MGSKEEFVDIIEDKVIYSKGHFIHLILMDCEVVNTHRGEDYVDRTFGYHS